MISFIFRLIILYRKAFFFVCLFCGTSFVSAQTTNIYDELEDPLGLGDVLGNLDEEEQYPIPGLIEDKPNIPMLNEEGIRLRLHPVKMSFAKGEELEIEIEIINVSPTKQNFRFLLEKNIFYQIQVNVYDQYSEVPLPSVTYASWQYLKQNPDLPNQNPTLQSLITPPSPRTIELEYGQSFRFPFNIGDFYNFSKEGVYYVEVVFYPALISMADYSFKSEEASFVLRVEDYLSPYGKSGNSDLVGLGEIHRPKFLDEVQVPLDRLKVDFPSSRETGDFSAYSPTRVVEKNLSDQQQNDWEAFLESFQLNSLLESSYLSTMFYERYIGASPSEIPIILEDFSRFLVESIDYIVLDFEPLQTVIRGDQARVEVLVSSSESFASRNEILNPVTGQVEQRWQDIEGGALTRTRVFVYELERIRGKWKIVGFDTRVRETIEIEPLAEDFALENAEEVGFVYFRLNESVLRDFYLPNLDKVIELASRDRTLKIRLVGYTDDLGTDEYNLRLASDRVDAVGRYFLDAGVEEYRIEREPRGEIDPFEDVITDEFRRQNRRVEIYFFR